MATGSVYSMDSSGFVWNGFDTLIEEGRLRSSIEVYGELEKKDDELFKWCKDRKEGLFVAIDDGIQTHVARFMKDYPRLVDTAKGRSGADPFVIALAATVNPMMVVVTEEQPGKQKFQTCVKQNKSNVLGSPI